MSEETEAEKLNDENYPTEHQGQPCSSPAIYFSALFFASELFLANFLFFLSMQNTFPINI